MKIHLVEQNTPEWEALRLGIVTASEMKCILAESKDRKMRNTYMNKLIGERITGQQASNYQSFRMELGHVMEADARHTYAETIDEEVLPGGFITNFEEIGGVGYSPDALVGEKGSAEIKSKDAHLQVELLLKDEVPTEHIAQLQCGLWVSEREWIDFISHCYGIPQFRRRVYRDDAMIKRMEQETKLFYEEMKEKMERIINLGGSNA